MLRHSGRGSVVGGWLKSLLAGVLLITVLAGDADAAAPRRGEPAPHFTLPDLKGVPYQLPGIARGKILVLHFWGSTCSFCRDEILVLKKLHAEKEADLLPISINVGESLLTVNNFVAKLEARYPLLLDGNSAVAKQFGVVGIPVTYIADRQGIIRFRIFGEINEAGIRKLLDVLLTQIP